VTKVTKSIEIEASPEKVFAFIINREKMNEASKGFTEGEFTPKDLLESVQLCILLGLLAAHRQNGTMK